MKRFFLTFIASLFFAATTIAFFPTSVKAASTWLSTDSLRVQNISEGYNVDYSETVRSASLLNLLAVTSSGGTCSSTEFDFAFSGGYIAVTQQQRDSPSAFYGELSVQIYYNHLGPTPFGETSVSTGFIEPPTFGKYASIFYIQGVGLQMTCSTSPPGYLPVAATNDITGTYFLVYYSTYPAVYPPGYDGSPVPDAPPSIGSSFIPEIGYYTDSENVLYANSIVGSSFTIPTNGGDSIPYLRWTVFGPDGETVLNTKDTDLSAPFEYRLPGNDTYYFEVTYISPLEYLGIPGAPFADDVVIIPVRFEINALGILTPGSNFLNECEVVDGVYVCNPGSPLQDCSSFSGVFPYGFLGEGEPADIVGGFNCNFYNFGISLQLTMLRLFVPSYSFFNGWVVTFGEFLNSKLGFVYSSFGFIGGLFGGIITNGATTACVIAPPGTLFDAPFEIDVCKLQEVVGNTVFQLIQGIVISLTILALMFAGYRKYLEVVDHR